MKDSYEESGRKLLNDPNFLSNLKTFARDNINDETIELLEPFMEVQDEWYNEGVVKAVN